MEGDGKAFKGIALAIVKFVQGNSEGLGKKSGCGPAVPGCVAGKVGTDVPVHGQTQVAGAEAVPPADQCSRQLVKDVAFGEAAQIARGCPVRAVGSDLLLFRFAQRGQVGTSGTEAELAIEPESAGLDRLLVFKTNLIRVDGNHVHAQQRTQRPQYLRVDPGGLALAKSIVGVEADLDPVEERDRFQVVDGHAVFQRDAAGVRAQGQAARGRNSPKKNLQAAARCSFVDG